MFDEESVLKATLVALPEDTHADAYRGHEIRLGCVLRKTIFNKRNKSIAISKQGSCSA